MIHIATVHYQTDKWIDIQMQFLKENIKQPFRVYAFLCGEAAKQREKFYYSCIEPIEDHATKLNILADVIFFATENKNEPLIFLDGDAFPIAPLDDFIQKTLHEFPLAAIQRKENVGDIQPHPSFCLTTIQFWKEIEGDWKEGFQWVSSENDLRTDTGGNLLKILSDKKIFWGKIHRTINNPFHPVFFGIYGDVIYHHGAGFRNPLSMHDRLKPIERYKGSKILAGIINYLLSKTSLKNRFRIHRLLGVNSLLSNINEKNSLAIHSHILRERNSFYEFLIEGNQAILASKG